MLLWTPVASTRLTPFLQTFLISPIEQHPIDAKWRLQLFSCKVDLLGVNP